MVGSKVSSKLVHSLFATLFSCFGITRVCMCVLTAVTNYELE